MYNKRQKNYQPFDNENELTYQKRFLSLRFTDY